MPLFDVDVEGVTYEVNAPDSATAWRWANQTHQQQRALAPAPATKPQPQSGFRAALGAGIQGLFGAGAALAGRTGFMDMEEAQRAVDARRQRQQEIFKPTEEWGLTKLSELLGGSIPYMAAPVAAAGAVAALPVTGTAAVATGLGAAGLASATQFTGTNLSRQIEEGKKLAETDLGSAALAAVPMALLDTLSLRMLPGVGKLLGGAGIKVTKETAKEVSEQILKKAAIDYTAATGRAMTVEGLTEAAQQGFERLQAGLNIADADARKEYFDALVGGALLGGAIAPVGRSMERGKAKREIAAIEQEEADQQAAAAREADAKRKQDPAYLEGLSKTYQELLAQKTALTQQLKKGTKEAPLSQEDRDANAVINEQISALKQPFERARKEFISAGGPQALAKLREGQFALTPPPAETPTAPEKPEAPEAQRARLAQDVAKLTELLEQQREAILKAATPEEALQIAQQAQQTYEALTAANTELGKLPSVPTRKSLERKEKDLLKKFEAARESGDQQAVLDIVPKLQEVRKQLAEAAPFDLASPEYAAEEQKKLDALGQAMGEGRETARENTRQTELEQQAAREEDARLAAQQQQLDLENWAEGEVAREQAENADYQASIKASEPLRTAPQLALFPEAQGRVARAETPLKPSERPPEVLPLRAELARLLAEKRKLKQPRVEVDDGRVAEIDARVAEIDARIAELEAVSRTAPGSLSELVPLRPEMSRLLAEKRALEQERATPRGEPVNDRIREIDTRVAEIEEQLTGLTQRAVETRSVMAPPDTPQADTRPQGPLPERLNALAERILASPRVDEETKELVRQVQDNLPALMQRDAGSVGGWLYRTLQGTAPPDLTQDIRNRLAELEAGRRSETEQETQRVRRPLTADERKAVAGTSLQGQRTVGQPQPTGETHRAVQTELDMPEPSATAFETLKEFQDYLASDMLAAVRGSVGPVRPTAERLERQLDELRQQAARYREDQRLLDLAAAALRQYVPEVVPPGAPVNANPQALAVAMERLSEANTEAIRAAQALLDNQQAFEAQVETASDADFKQFLVEDTKRYFDLQQQLRRVAGFKSQVSKQRNLIAAAERRANLVELEASAAATAAPAERRADFSDALAKAKAKEAGALEKQVREQEATAKKRAAEGAARRQPATFTPEVETQGQREARSAKTRAAEQASLERLEALPGMRITYDREEKQDFKRALKALEERFLLATTKDEIDAVKADIDTYLASYAADQDAKIDEAKRKASKNLQDLSARRKEVAELTERLKGKLTPKRRASAEKQLKEAQERVQEHQRRYAINASEIKLVRTDIQAARKARNDALAEANRKVVAGKRLGVAEDTRKRAIGPVTRPEVYPPKTMYTGSEESRAGETTANKRNALQEARGVQQRDVPMKASEQAEANKIAEALRKKTPEQQAKEQKEEAAVQKEQAALQAQPTKVKPLKEAAKKSKTKPTRSEVVEGIDEDLYEEPDIELLGGPEEDVYLREAGQKYETRDLTDLSPAATDALEDGDIRTALADLEKNGSTPFVRALAKRLGDMTMRTTLDVRDSVVHDGEVVEGVYSPTQNSVLLHRAALSEETLTHELAHAATVRALEADPKTLTPAQQAARKEIEALHAAIQKQPDFAREYGRKNVKEFVSELLSNIDFRNKLDKQKPSFIRRVYDALLRLLGVPQATRSEQAVKAAYALFMPAQKLKAAAAPSAQRGGAGLATASRVADSLIAKEKGWLDKIKANLRAGRAQHIDKLAPVEEALKGGKVDDLKATQARYNLRMYDQRMHFTAQAIYDGAPGLIEKTRKDGRTERLVESVPGANIKQIVDILKAKDVVKEAGSPDAANKLFTLYLAAIRGERVGYDALNFKVNADDINAARAEIEANPTLKTAFDKAREVYNNYNRNLIQFAIDTGAIGKEKGRALLQSNDYIPYYRVRDGVAELMIGKETPVRIGNLKDSPHLKELVGGDEAIFDFLTSSVQNTSMLMDMSMRNLAVKNLMFEFRDVGLAKIGKVKGGKAPTGSVTFTKDGEDYFAVVDTDAIGVDSELLVKGLAGIPTMFPTLIQVFGVPARLLRRLVVASPVYMAKALVRDSSNAAIASGADIAPVLSSVKQIGKPSVLARRGITGGMVFTGMPEDQTRLLKEMQAGKISLSSGLARLEALSAKVDALTREAQYESYREQGLSEMEATLMALESMNFSRRGLSPTMHMLSTLLPFFNAQIQGLDVLYRSFRGDMPFNERLQVREKLFKRGMMLFGMSMMYATLMQDDEAYQNAKVEEKYSNFFVPVPGTDQLMRVPIPFELGYIFKALPEALVNMIANEGGGEEALKALQHIAKQTVPGLSSWFIPQALKPALEVATDYSIFTGRGLESSRETLVEPGFRYRDNTTELAKMVGEATGFSPIKMEYLIRGYTGSLGMAAMAALSAPFGSSGPESAAKRPSDLPVVGTLFQPTDASGIIDLVYEKLGKAREVQQTYKSLIEKGRPEDAQKYLDENIESLMLTTMAGQFTKHMGEITEYERSIRSSNMTPEEKRAALDEARQAKIELAKAVRDQLGKTTRQAVPA